MNLCVSYLQGIFCAVKSKQMLQEKPVPCSVITITKMYAVINGLGKCEIACFSIKIVSM
jgi:hypothetical protein